MPEKISQAHWEGEVWGCAVDPTSQKFVTSGGDKTIRIWDIATKQMESSTDPMPYGSRAVDWSSSGRLIAAADAIGHIHLFNERLEKIVTHSKR